ncbi:MAG: septum formation initiator family protein [Eubacteriales bacterium]|jgi:cell division protein FtsB
MDTTKNENKAIMKRSKNLSLNQTTPQKVETARTTPKNNTSKGVIKAEKSNLPSRDGRKYIVKRTVIIETKKRNKKPLPLGAIFTIAVTTLLFIFLLMNYAEIDSYNREVATLKDRLTDLKKDADKLEQRLDKKNDLIYFEQYAVDKLGMVKETELTRINITALPENTGDAFKYDDEKPRGIGVLLSGFGDVIRDFFD